MPFSRRAEAEADLIGLKLMAIAGYNADKAPETFRRLGAMEVGGKMAGLAGSDTARMVLQVGTPGSGCAQKPSNHLQEAICVHMPAMLWRLGVKEASIRAGGGLSGFHTACRSHHVGIYVIDIPALKPHFIPV